MPNLSNELPVFIADDSEAAFQSEDFPLSRWSFQVSCISALCRAKCHADSSQSFAVVCGSGKPRMALPASSIAASVGELHGISSGSEPLAILPALKLALLAARQGHKKVVVFVGSEVSASAAEMEGIASSFVQAGISLDVVVLGSSTIESHSSTQSLAMLINAAESKARDHATEYAAGSAHSANSAGLYYRCMMVHSPNADMPLFKVAMPILQALGMTDEEFSQLKEMDASSDSDEELEIHDPFEGLNPSVPPTVTKRRSSKASTCTGLKADQTFSAGTMNRGLNSPSPSSSPSVTAAAAPSGSPVGASVSSVRRSANAGNCRFESLDSLQHLSTDGFIRSWLPSYSNIPGSVTITETGGLNVAGAKGGSPANRFCFITIQQSKQVPKWAKVLTVSAGRVMPEEASCSAAGAFTVQASVEVVSDEDDSDDDCPPQLLGSHAHAAPPPTSRGHQRMCSDNEKGSLSFLMAPDDPSELRLMWTDKTAEEREKCTSIFGPGDDTCQPSSGDGLKEEGARLVLKLSPTQTRFRAVAAGRNQVLQVEGPASYTYYPENSESVSAGVEWSGDTKSQPTSSKVGLQHGAVKDLRGRTSFFFWLQQSYTEDGLTGALALAEKLQCLLESPPDYESSPFPGIGGVRGQENLQLGPLPLSLVMEIMKASGRERKDDGSFGPIAPNASAKGGDGGDSYQNEEDAVSNRLGALASDLVGELRSRLLPDKPSPVGTSRQSCHSKGFGGRRGPDARGHQSASSLVAEDDLQCKLGISSMVPPTGLDLATMPQDSLTGKPRSSRTHSQSASSSATAPVTLGQCCNENPNPANEESIIFDLD